MFSQNQRISISVITPADMYSCRILIHIEQYTQTLNTSWRQKRLTFDQDCWKYWDWDLSGLSALSWFLHVQQVVQSITVPGRRLRKLGEATLGGARCPMIAAFSHKCLRLAAVQHLTFSSNTAFSTSIPDCALLPIWFLTCYTSVGITDPDTVNMIISNSQFEMLSGQGNRVVVSLRW